MLCELCGKNVDSLVKAKVEGTVLSVCENCGSFGQIIGRIGPPKQLNSNESRKEEHVFVKKEIIEVVVPDYPQIIRKARETLGLDQENFAAKICERVSIVHKMETGHYVPDLKLAHKLEKMLGIHLIEVTSELHGVANSLNKKESSIMTLGDLMKKK